MTPDEWRDRLLERLDEQARNWARFDRYYSGDHPLPDAPPGARREYLRLMELARSNWCELIVDAVAERLTVAGVRFGQNQAADVDVWDTIWQPNRLDGVHGTVHTEALVGGVAAVLVWPADNPGDAPSITVEHPTQVYVDNDGPPRRPRRAAIKRWSEDGAELVTMQLDGAHTPTGEAMVYKWRREQTAARWEPRAGTDDPGEAFVNPLGVVSFVPFYNKPRMMGRYRSELGAGVTGIQDRINETIFNRLTAGRFAAFRQRWATGMEIPTDPETNRPIEPFRAAVDRLWVAEDSEVSFGEFAATDLRPYIESVEADIQHLAAITRTPPHYLLGQSGAFPSGESLKATETGLVRKVEARALAFGESWEEVVRLGLAAMEDARAADDSLEVIWAEHESQGLGELSDYLVKLKALGVPDEALWERAGASPQEIRRWRGQQARAELVAARTPSSSPPPPVPPLANAAEAPAPPAEAPAPAR